MKITYILKKLKLFSFYCLVSQKEHNISYKMKTSASELLRNLKYKGGSLCRYLSFEYAHISSVSFSLQFLILVVSVIDYSIILNVKEIVETMEKL